MNKPSLFIAVPAYDQRFLAHTAASLITLCMYLTMRGSRVAFTTYSYFDLVRLRNLLLTRFYDRQTEATHMLFVDADMGFEPANVQALIDADKPLVGAVYPTRSHTGKIGEKGFVGSFLPDRTPDENGLMEVRGLGGGLMLISRACITRLIESQPELIDTREPDEVLHGDLMKEMGLSRVIRAFDYLATEEGGKKGECGEDVSFCLRVRKAGMEVWGDVGHPLSHIGLHEWYGCMGPVAQGKQVAA